MCEFQRQPNSAVLTMGTGDGDKSRRYCVLRLHHCVRCCSFTRVTFSITKNPKFFPIFFPPESGTEEAMKSCVDRRGGAVWCAHEVGNGKCSLLQYYCQGWRRLHCLSPPFFFDTCFLGYGFWTWTFWLKVLVQSKTFHGTVTVTLWIRLLYFESTTVTKD